MRATGFLLAAGIVTGIVTEFYMSLVTVVVRPGRGLAALIVEKLYMNVLQASPRLYSFVLIN